MRDSESKVLAQKMNEWINLNLYAEKKMLIEGSKVTYPMLIFLCAQKIKIKAKFNNKRVRKKGRKEAAPVVLSCTD